MHRSTFGGFLLIVWYGEPIVFNVLYQLTLKYMCTRQYFFSMGNDV